MNPHSVTIHMRPARIRAEPERFEIIGKPKTKKRTVRPKKAAAPTSDSDSD
jgi:hypothetical protein